MHGIKCVFVVRTQRSFYTEKLLNREVFTIRNFYTQMLLHRETFCTQTLLHIANFSTQEFFHRETFAHRCFYTEELLRAAKFYTQKLLHREEFTQMRTLPQCDLNQPVAKHKRIPRTIFQKWKLKMWKRSFRARFPSQTESWRCENEAFERDLPPKVKVEDVKTKLL